MLSNKLIYLLLKVSQVIKFNFKKKVIICLRIYQYFFDFLIEFFSDHSKLENKLK